MPAPSRAARPHGRIVDEWTVYDELSLLMQIKLGQMAERERGRGAMPS